MNSLISPSATREESPLLEYQKAGILYLQSVEQEVRQLWQQGLIHNIKSYNSNESEYGQKIVTIGDTTTAKDIVVFTHDRYGVELTSPLGLCAISSRVFTDGALGKLVDEGKLAIAFLFCSNPNGIINQTRNLGDGTGADIMRSSKIVPHLRPWHTYDGIFERGAASPLFSGDKTAYNHLSEAEYPLPPEAKFQQDYIEGFLRNHQNIFQIDVHADATALKHLVLFSPAHTREYTKILNGEHVDLKKWNGKQFVKISDFYETTRKLITHQELPLKGLYQYYRSIGDPIDYHTAKSVRDASYQGTYQSLTYEIPTARYVLEGLINGKSYMPHLLDNLINYPFDSRRMILNPSQLYNIPETHMPQVAATYTHNVSNLLTGILSK